MFYTLVIFPLFLLIRLTTKKRKRITSTHDASNALTNS
jgi:hypothetical protein